MAQHTKNAQGLGVGYFAQVEDLDDTLAFVSDSQTVEHYRDYLGNKATQADGFTFSLSEYGSFFVEILDSEYGEIWAMWGIIPLETNEVVRVR